MGLSKVGQEFLQEWMGLVGISSGTSRSIFDKGRYYQKHPPKWSTSPLNVMSGKTHVIEKSWEGIQWVKVVKDMHFVDLCWCVLTGRAVEQGSIRSVKASTGNGPMDLVYVCQNNVCVCLSDFLSHTLASPNEPAVPRPVEFLLTHVHLSLIRGFLNWILIEIRACGLMTLY